MASPLDGVAQPAPGEEAAVARWLRRLHLVMMFVWPLLAIPALLWWKDSITFVIALSLYANFAGDFAAYQGARAEMKHDGDEG